MTRQAAAYARIAERVAAYRRYPSPDSHRALALAVGDSLPRHDGRPPRMTSTLTMIVGTLAGRSA